MIIHHKKKTLTKKHNKLHVIYIPGLGDSNVSNQIKVVNTWKWWGVEAELFRMNWSDDVKWEIKFNKLLARIDELANSGKKIGLVGASAGAGAVINAMAARQSSIIGAVCICGKINFPEDISSKFFDSNSSFKASAFEAPNSLDKINMEKRKSILSRYAPYDETVRRRDSVIEGARNRTILTVGHFITIALHLLFGAPSFLRFLKKQM